MPPQQANLRKDRLTLAQLAAYDDVITDALVDHVYFWTQIRKNRAKYFASRGVREEDVSGILQRWVIVEQDPAKAEHELLQLSGLRRYVDRLKTVQEKDDFRKHLRRYINIYLPECAFEVSTTNRYTIVTQEAAVTSRRLIKRGEAIKYLSGIQVSMSKDEEAELGTRRRDFSIVMSSRKKSASLFLGPARFANHDCDANARLITTGTQGMEVGAVREIDAGEEITVSYGDDYFGEGNRECLCKTCEGLGRNGWVSKSVEDISSGVTAPPLIGDKLEGPYSFRRKRKYGFDRDSMTPLSSSETRQTPTLKKHAKSKPKRPAALNECHTDPVSDMVVKVEDEPCDARQMNTSVMDTQWSVEGSTRRKPALIGETTGIQTKPPDQDPTNTGDSFLATIAVPSTAFDSPSEPSPNDNVRVGTRDAEGPLSTGSRSPTLSAGDSSQVSIATTVTSVLDDTSTDKPSMPSQVPSRPYVAVSSAAENTDDSKSHAQTPPTVLMDQVDPTEDVDPINKAMRKARLPTIAPRSPSTVISSIDTPPSVTDLHRRIPGDYVLTSSLLSEPYSAWVLCSVCDSAFVQADAYFTRSACPRCERHSKLYGYAWPKTQKECKSDREERVLDHRTVHRFLRPKEEKEIKKGKVRDLNGRESTASSAPEESLTSEESMRTNKGLRGRRRPSNRQVE
ncbi:MAG: Histone-lysine N-methyltransferase set9 [Piccolia ochrophora]|nr:MAG: Histone-lysine N-methyltransferase set9 [Piccolia ochrophora]